MGKVISINATPERLHAILEGRYAGFAAWEALRLRDYEIVCHECLLQLQAELPVPIACRMMELISLSYYYLGDFRSAVLTLDQVINVCPTHPILQIVHAECLGRLGRIDGAIDMLASIAEAVDSDLELMMLTAGSLETLGAFHLALRVTSDVCSLDPYNAHYLIDLSYYTYRVHGLVQSVAALAWQAVRLEPGAMEYRVWLSKVLSAMQSHREAYEVIADANRKQIASIDCSCCLVQLAQQYEAAGDQDRLSCCMSRLQELGNSTSTYMERFRRVPLPSSSLLRVPSTVDGVPYGENDL